MKFKKFILSKVKKKAVNGNAGSGLQLKKVSPKTINQKRAFDNWNRGQHLLLHGLAGTGKTFIALYLALEALYNKECEKIFIVRSALPSRDLGFMPGNMKEKIQVYESPYYQVCEELFGRTDAYDVLKQQGKVEFVSTSFFRGMTFRESIVIFDEFQNTEMNEFVALFTRIGENTRIIVCGDIYQSDLTFSKNRSFSIPDMIRIMEDMSCMSSIEFNVNDIVRSKFVKEFILAKERLTQNASS